MLSFLSARDLHSPSTKFRSISFLLTDQNRVLAAAAIAVALIAAPLLVAQAGPSGNAPEMSPPPPSQSAAVRLSDVEGAVQLTSGNMILASQALVNTPVFEGTLLTTGDDGRAELQFDDGSVARIPPDSSLLVRVLRKQGSADQSELDVQSGMAYFELQPTDSGDSIRVRFGDNVITTSGFTVMRVKTDTPPGELAVFSGNAHLASGTALALDLHGGETVNLNAKYPDKYQLAESISPDSWDEWNSDRDEALTTAEADRTLPKNALPDGSNPAYSDLDANGNWYNVPGQGYVWSPYEAQSAGWDPYGCGSWMWTPSFGYIWVSCESWGYMPYMSGMWNYYGGFGWGWSPGYGYNPWWNSGGWTNNVGSGAVDGARKFKYEAPKRPRGGPIMPTRSSVNAGEPLRQPHKIVIVDRMKNAQNAPLIRPQGAPLTVAGRTIEPVRPVSTRQRASFSTFDNGRRTSTVPTTAGGRYNGFVQAPPSMMPARPVFTGSVNERSGFVNQSSGFGGNMQRPEAPHFTIPRPPEASVVNRSNSNYGAGFRPQGEPSTGMPRMGGPSMGAPRMSAPSVGAPRMSAPSMSAPRMGAPSMGGGPAMSAPHASSGGGRPR
ncbi:MAG: FecR domain-containing protein [Acidobacteriota bacterium]|nr:FecR domain-containing protein [Acidobacteriota bacterium]